jgi:hypothetical protein
MCPEAAGGGIRRLAFAPCAGAPGVVFDLRAVAPCAPGSLRDPPVVMAGAAISPGTG